MSELLRPAPTKDAKKSPIKRSFTRLGKVRKQIGLLPFFVVLASGINVGAAVNESRIGETIRDAGKEVAEEVVEKVDDIINPDTKLPINQSNDSDAPKK